MLSSPSVAQASTGFLTIWSGLQASRVSLACTRFSTRRARYRRRRHPVRPLRLASLESGVPVRNAPTLRLVWTFLHALFEAGLQNGSRHIDPLLCHAGRDVAGCGSGCEMRPTKRARLHVTTPGREGWLLPTAARVPQSHGCAAASSRANFSRPRSVQQRGPHQAYIVVFALITFAICVKRRGLTLGKLVAIWHHLQPPDVLIVTIAE